MTKTDRLLDLKYDYLKHETAKAYLLKFGHKDVWLPKSQVELDEADQVVTMPEWLAIEKEIDSYVIQQKSFGF